MRTEKMNLPIMTGKWWEPFLRKFEPSVPEVFQKNLDYVFSQLKEESDEENEEHHHHHHHASSNQNIHEALQLTNNAPNDSFS